MVQETTDPHEFNGSKVDELMTLCGQLETILSTGDDIRRLIDALLHEALASSEE